MIRSTLLNAIETKIFWSFFLFRLIFCQICKTRLYFVFFVIITFCRKSNINDNNFENVWYFDYCTYNFENFITRLSNIINSSIRRIKNNDIMIWIFLITIWHSIEFIVNVRVSITILITFLWRRVKFETLNDFNAWKKFSNFFQQSW